MYYFLIDIVILLYMNEFLFLKRMFEFSFYVITGLMSINFSHVYRFLFINGNI
jgi:hypothetical protein